MMERRLTDLDNEAQILAELTAAIITTWQGMTSNGMLADLLEIQEQAEIVLEDVKYVRDRVYVEQVLTDDE